MSRHHCLFIHGFCFLVFLWIRFFLTRSLESYTIDHDKRVWKVVFWPVFRWVTSPICLLHQSKTKTKKQQKKGCSSAVSSLRTSPASDKCCIEWPYTCHQFEQESPSMAGGWGGITLMNWCGVGGWRERLTPGSKHERQVFNVAFCWYEALNCLIPKTVLI